MLKTLTIAELINFKTYLRETTLLKKRLLLSQKPLINNVREKIRTPGLLIRSQTLYPAELRVHMGPIGLEPMTLCL